MQTQQQLAPRKLTRQCLVQPRAQQLQALRQPPVAWLSLWEAGSSRLQHQVLQHPLQLQRHLRLPLCLQRRLRSTCWVVMMCMCPTVSVHAWVHSSCCGYCVLYEHQ
jgi:hypothetical protein